MLIVCCCWLAACRHDDKPSDTEVKEAYITDSMYVAKDSMKVYNFVYPSTDPYGKEVMLSGTITMGHRVESDKTAKGLLLYNHFTVYRADQCPSMGDLQVQAMLAPEPLIIVSPDYYGFGATVSEHQAYCISSINAQGALDALLAAKKLLAAMGYDYNGRLFNAGYSQGGQTAIGVMRLVAEKYPDIHFTCTFAGAGSYDIPATYRHYMQDSVAEKPSHAISVLLAYNEFSQINAPLDELFIEPVLSHIDDWFFSKRYKREDLDEMLVSVNVSDFFTPAIIDLQSDLAQRFLNAMEADNLCNGWTPRRDEPVVLFHNTQDATVPPVNTENLYRFLIGQGASKVTLDVDDYGNTAALPAHQMGALYFIQHSLERMREMMAAE